MKRSATMDVNRHLDGQEVTKTLDRLRRRIGERFPGSSLEAISGDLITIAGGARETADWVARPIVSVRAGIALLIGIMILGVAQAVHIVRLPQKSLGLLDFVQALEAGINDVILLGLGIFFLVSLENRIKRRKVLAHLHDLRVMAHVIDMHQLTKDPERTIWKGPSTASSPERTLTPFLLGRYLDYCSELLALIGKITVLYVQNFNDPVVLASVNEIQGLTTGLARKVWQKLMILHGHHELTRGPQEG